MNLYPVFILILDGWWSFCLVGALVIELFYFEINVPELDLQVIFLLLDVQVESQQSLEVRDAHMEVSVELSNSNLHLQGLVDVAIEVSVVVVVIDIENLIEVKPKNK